MESKIEEILNEFDDFQANVQLDCDELKETTKDLKSENESLFRANVELNQKVLTLQNGLEAMRNENESIKEKQKEQECLIEALLRVSLANENKMNEMA